MTLDRIHESPIRARINIAQANLWWSIYNSRHIDWASATLRGETECRMEKEARKKVTQRRTLQKRKVKRQPKQMYRVEGIGRRGVIRYVKVIGHPGSWTIRGMDGLNFHVVADTVQDAVQRARKRIPFRPIVIRPVSADGTVGASITLPPAPTPTAKPSRA